MRPDFRFWYLPWKPAGKNIASRPEEENVPGSSNTWNPTGNHLGALKCSPWQARWGHWAHIQVSGSGEPSQMKCLEAPKVLPLGCWGLRLTIGNLPVDPFSQLTWGGRLGLSESEEEWGRWPCWGRGRLLSLLSEVPRGNSDSLWRAYSGLGRGTEGLIARLRLVGKLEVGPWLALQPVLKTWSFIAFGGLSHGEEVFWAKKWMDII